MKRAALAICLLVAAAPACAAERYMMIGGGPFPASSQVSIESNVLWLQQVLAARHFATGRTWFAAGPTGVPDVIYEDRPDADSRRLQPLARIYGQVDDNNRHFRPNKVTNNAGAASLENVTTALSENLAALKPGDGLLLIYSGHGSQGRKPGDNGLRLWGDKELTADAFRTIMATTPAGSHVRFVMPQCFSGAFVGTTPSALSSARGTTSAPVCGFASVSANVGAEGCTPGIDVGDYRDYATYFVAALVGNTRTGAPLSRNPDLDGDGATTMLEAHYYAFSEAASKDVPRSTSEQFLELAQPWLLRWLPASGFHEDNPYLKLATRIAERIGLATPTPAAIDARGRAASADVRDAHAAMDLLTAEETKTRAELRHLFENRWPQAAAPYTQSFKTLLFFDADQMLAWIVAQPLYAPLVRLQDQIAAAELTLLDKQRDLAQVVKLQRARRLATLYEQVSRSYSRDDAQTLAALRTCESWILPR